MADVLQVPNVPDAFGQGQGEHSQERQGGVQEVLRCRAGFDGIQRNERWTRFAQVPHCARHQQRIMNNEQQPLSCLQILQIASGAHRARAVCLNARHMIGAATVQNGARLRQTKRRLALRTRPRRRHCRVPIIHSPSVFPNGIHTAHVQHPAHTVPQRRTNLLHLGRSTIVVVVVVCPTRRRRNKLLRYPRPTMAQRKVIENVGRFVVGITAWTCSTNGARLRWVIGSMRCLHVQT